MTKQDEAISPVKAVRKRKKAAKKVAVTKKVAKRKYTKRKKTVKKAAKKSAKKKRAVKARKAASSLPDVQRALNRTILRIAGLNAALKTEITDLIGSLQ